MMGVDVSNTYIYILYVHFCAQMCAMWIYIYIYIYIIYTLNTQHMNWFCAIDLDRM